MKRKKNVVAFIKKTISLIEIKQKIIEWELQQSFQFYKNREIVTQKLQWSGTVADLVEFAYGALETNKIENGDIDIVVLIEKLSRIFSIEVKDCYDTFRAIRRRTGSRTLFLDEMKKKLNERMDDMDNGIFKKKKVRK